MTKREYSQYDIDDACTILAIVGSSSIQSSFVDAELAVIGSVCSPVGFLAADAWHYAREQLGRFTDWHELTDIRIAAREAEALLRCGWRP